MSDHKLVPVESSNEMDHAGVDALRACGLKAYRVDAERCWSAMVAAAPIPEQAASIEGLKDLQRYNKHLNASSQGPFFLAADVERFLATQLAKQGAQPAELTDAAIDDVWDAMPGGADGWLKQFGYRQFARSIANHVLVRVAASMAGTIRPSDDELWNQTIGERDHYHDMADKLAEAIGKHFGIEIGEHSNMNCPWHTALGWIETENTVAEMAVAAQVQADVRDQALLNVVKSLFWKFEQGAAPYKVDATLNQLANDEATVGVDPGDMHAIFVAAGLLPDVERRAASTDGEVRSE